MRKKTILAVALLATTAVTLTSFASKSSLSRSELVQRNIDALVEIVQDPRKFEGYYKNVTISLRDVDDVYVSINGQIHSCDGTRLYYEKCDGKGEGRLFCNLGASYLIEVSNCIPIYEVR